MAANTTMYSPSYVSHCNIQCYTDTIMYALVGGTIKVDSLEIPYNIILIELNPKIFILFGFRSYTKLVIYVHE